MQEFISQYGGLSNICAIGLFIFAFFLITSTIKQLWLRLLLSTIFSLFIGLQITSLFATQTFIGYGFYVHFNLRGSEGIYGLFISEIIKILSFTIVCFIAFIYSKRIVIGLLKALGIKTLSLSLISILSYTLALASFITITFKSSFTEDSSALLSILYGNNNIRTFEEVLKENNLEGYISSEQVKSSSGKNIIILSLESLEKGFLDPKYQKATPNLQRLKSTWNYYPIEPNSGSNWTSGSLYTTLTGFPAFFGVNHNAIFQKVYDSKISSISAALSHSGYETVFMNGNTNFSGTKEMLNVLQFDRVIDKKNTHVVNESEYGIRDMDLFDLAKKEVDRLDQKKEPYLLFISTTDTHFPNGIYDERMEQFISTDEKGLEFMIAALDYLVNDFIEYLKQNQLLKNTSIFILPDHLKMGSGLMLRNTGSRGLYLLTNETIDIEQKPAEPFYQIDLPKLILDGANIEHNIQFYTDFIVGDKETHIRKHIPEITEINTNGLKRFHAEPFEAKNISKKYDTYISDNSRYIAHAGGAIDGITYTNSLEAINLSYSKGFKMFELDLKITSDSVFVATHDWNSWVKKTGYHGPIPPTHRDFMNHKIYGKYTPMDIDSINNWFLRHTDAILVTDKTNDPKSFSEVFCDKQRLIMELFNKDAVDKALSLNLLGVWPSQNMVTHWNEKDIKEWVQKGVDGVAISRELLPYNKTLFKQLKSNGIKVYAFHINHLGLFDEDFVTRYEMDYYYGIYADNWDFRVKEKSTARQ